MAIRSAPSWSEQKFLGDFELVAPNQDQHSVGGCDWLDSGKTVVLVDNWPVGGGSDTSAYVGLLNTTDGTLTRLTPDEGKCCWGSIYVAPEAGLVYWTYVRSTLLVTEQPGQPESVDVATGQGYSLLQKGDWIVGVVTP